MLHLLSPQQLNEQVDLMRLEVTRRLDQGRRGELGQYLTPTSVAALMASMVEASARHIALLDAGAGVGSLLSAVVSELCQRPEPPQSIKVVTYEIDPLLIAPLHHTLELCQALCEQAGVEFVYEVIEGDFIVHAVEQLRSPLFNGRATQFNLAILNPPYRKIRGDSQHRILLSQVGIETSNLYTGFLALAIQLLAPEGELVAITPRSFCNGPYFRPFRAFLLDTMTLREIHVFDSRQQAFEDDSILQENVIIATKKIEEKPDRVRMSVSTGPEDDLVLVRDVSYDQVIKNNDPEQFIRLPVHADDDHASATLSKLHTTLAQLGLKVSTGRVVDFRATAHLRSEPGADTVPLIYPVHLSAGSVRWPQPHARKPNAIVANDETYDLLVPDETYVLIRRLSAKEERRRVVAVVYSPLQQPKCLVGFENHLNYIHASGRGLEPELAHGLALYLNSTLVDRYFRQFSGHTQVNATDLRSLPYPTREQLLHLGRRGPQQPFEQHAIDALLMEEYVDMTEPADPLLQSRRQRLQESMSILQALGFPRAQQNERSALTLLALLDMHPDKAWAEASAPLCGITPMMEFFARHYGKTYKPNTRETVRRQTVHQFMDAGLVIANPDQPDRPVNSPRAVYQISSLGLQLLRSFGSDTWDTELRRYLEQIKTLRERYARERLMARIPVVFNGDKQITLSPGGQNILIKNILTEFAERFAPGGEVLYVGDTGEKFAYFNEQRLSELGVVIEVHGKFPDVVIYDASRNWLLLIEAVTSHGPIDPKRRGELARLFNNATAGLVYVTAFLTRQMLKEYLAEISWETEVWVAEAPSHLIHFDGDRFLGPYSS